MYNEYSVIWEYLNELFSIANYILWVSKTYLYVYHELKKEQKRVWG